MFHLWSKNVKLEAARLEAGEMTIHVIPCTNQLTVSVVGRVSVDSSPVLRSALLKLLRPGAIPDVVIDLSGVSYLDMAGLATLLEALKAAHENSVKLHVAGMSGEARTLAEIAQLDKIFQSWGAEVEFR